VNEIPQTSWADLMLARPESLRDRQHLPWPEALTLTQAERIDHVRAMIELERIVLAAWAAEGLRAGLDIRPNRIAKEQPNPYHSRLFRGLVVELYYGFPSYLHTPWGKLRLPAPYGSYPDVTDRALDRILSSLAGHVHGRIPRKRTPNGEYGPWYVLTGTPTFHDLGLAAPILNGMSTEEYENTANDWLVCRGIARREEAVQSINGKLSGDLGKENADGVREEIADLARASYFRSEHVMAETATGVVTIGIDDQVPSSVISVRVEPDPVWGEG
jgi:hypothetical protein